MKNLREEEFDVGRSLITLERLPAEAGNYPVEPHESCFAAATHHLGPGELRSAHTWRAGVTEVVWKDAYFFFHFKFYITGVARFYLFSDILAVDS